MSDEPAASLPGAAAAESPPAAPRRRRWRRALLVALLLAVVAVAALRAALPLALERGVAWGTRYYLGLPSRLDGVDLGLLQGRLKLVGFALGARPDGVSPRDAALAPPLVDPKGVLFAVGRAQLQLSWRDLWQRRVHLTELVIEAPGARLARDADGRVEPLRHARPAPAEPDAPSEPDVSASAWTFAVDRLQLLVPSVELVDETSGRKLFELLLEDLSLERVELAKGQFELGGLGVQGPVVRVRRELLARPAEAPAATPPAGGPAPAAARPASPAPPPDPAAAPAASGGAGYRIAQVDVERASVSWVTDQGPLDVAVTLHARDVRADPGRRFPFELALELDDGSVRAAGEAALLPPAFAGTLAWTGIPIPRLLVASVPQYAPWLRAADSSGELSLDADLGAAPPRARASGRLVVDGVDAADPDGSEVTLGWRQLEVLVREAVAPIPQAGKPVGPTRAALERVTLVEPKLRYTRPSPQLDALLGIDLSGTGARAPADDRAAAPADGAFGAAPGAIEPGAAPDPAVPAAAPARSSDGALELQIGRLELVKGTVEALDRTVEPPARTRVRRLTLNARDVRWPDASVADVKLGASLPGQARLDVSGALRRASVGDFALALRRLELPAFNPYANAVAGLTVERGAASVDAKIALRGERTEIDNRLVLHRLALSLRDPGTFERTYGVPIDLALALMRDPQGDIALHLPVAIGAQGTELGLGAAFGSALRAALLGALRSPLRLAGAAIGGGGDVADGLRLEALASVPGKNELTEDALDRIDDLAGLLAERPQLALELRGRAGPSDHPALAEALLAERAASGGELPSLEGAGFLARRRVANAFEHRARGEPVALEPDDRALYDRYVEATPVPAGRLDALARARADAARAALTEAGVAAERVTLRDPAAPGDPAVVLSFEAVEGTNGGPGDAPAPAPPAAAESGQPAPATEPRAPAQEPG